MHSHAPHVLNVGGNSHICKTKSLAKLLHGVTCYVQTSCQLELPVFIIDTVRWLFLAYTSRTWCYIRSDEPLSYVSRGVQRQVC